MARRNLIVNPSFETGVHAWTTNDTGLTTESGPLTPPSGSDYAFDDATSTGDMWVQSPLMPVTAGLEHTGSAYVNADGATGVQVDIDWYDSGDNFLSSSRTNWGPPPDFADGTFARMHSTGTAPATATQARLFVRVEDVAGGKFIRVDAFLFEEGPIQPYFDGDTGDAGWDGTPHNSTSTRDTDEFRIWPFTAGGPSISGLAPITTGNEFYVTETAWVTIVWYYRTDGNINPSQCAIYEVDSASSGTLVPDTFFNMPPASATAVWQGGVFPEPVQLTANQRYRVVMYYPTGSIPFTVDYFEPGEPGGDGLFNGPLVMPGEADVTGTDGTMGPQSSYTQGTGIQYPVTRFGGNLWVDVTVTTTDPTAVTLSGSATLQTSATATLELEGVVTLSGSATLQTDASADFELDGVVFLSGQAALATSASAELVIALQRSPVALSWLPGSELSVQIAWGADLADPPSWDWVDVTRDVRYNPAIEITTGRADEASTSQPAECRLSLDNRRGDFTLGGLSANWPNVRRNTPVRVTVSGVSPQTHALVLSGNDHTYLSTPDSAALSITGDFDFRIEFEHDDPHLDANMGVARKFVRTDDDSSWAVYMLDGNTVGLRLWTNGVDFTDYLSTTDLGALNRRQALRVTVDVANGSGGHDVTFYTADDIDGPWTQLGTVVTGSGTTSIFDSSAPVEIGRLFTPAGTGIVSEPFAGTVYAVQVYDGIDGTRVVDVDTTTLDPATRVFTDAAGVVWTIEGTAYIRGGDTLFLGYATGFTPSWDLSGNVATVDLTASGALRRLNQRNKPLRSSLFRDLSVKDDVVAYWPMEEGKQATVFTSGLANDRGTLVPTSLDEISLSRFSDFVASAPLPTFEAIEVAGDVPAYAGAADQRLIFLLSVPEDGVSGNRVLARPETQPSGSGVSRWLISITPGGDLFLVGADSGNNNVFTSPTVISGINGELLMMSLWLQQSGSTTNWQLSWFEVGADTGAILDGSTTTTFGRFTRMRFGHNAADGMSNSAYGHVAIINDDVHSIWDVIDNSLQAWEGEQAGNRLTRLCREEGQPIRITGPAEVTMGPQTIEAFMSLLRECEAADLGVLYDGAGPGLAYVSRTIRENAPVTLTVATAAGQLAAGFEVVDDDQRTVNDATAVQKNGSSASAVDLDGPMGVAAVGRYDTEVRVNIEEGTSQHLRDHASWRINLGTVEGYRFPKVTVNLRHDPELAPDVMNVDVSSRIDVTNPRAAFRQLAGDIRLLVEGAEHQINGLGWTVTATCSPYDPWRVVVLAESSGDTNPNLCHLGTDGSQVAVNAVAGVSSLQVAVTDGPLWTTDTDDFPFEIDAGGIPVLVTAITGASSPQTLHVDPTTVIKTLRAGTAVQIRRQPGLSM